MSRNTYKTRYTTTSEFLGVKKGGIKGEVERGRWVGKETGPQGERGARKYTRKTLILVPPKI